MHGQQNIKKKKYNFIPIKGNSVIKIKHMPSSSKVRSFIPFHKSLEIL